MHRILSVARLLDQMSFFHLVNVCQNQNAPFNLIGQGMSMTIVLDFINGMGGWVLKVKLESITVLWLNFSGWFIRYILPKALSYSYGLTWLITWSMFQLSSYFQVCSSANLWNQEEGRVADFNQTGGLLQPAECVSPETSPVWLEDFYCCQTADVQQPEKGFKAVQFGLVKWCPWPWQRWWS